MKPFITAFYRMVASFQNNRSPLLTKKMSSTVRFCFNMRQVISLMCHKYKDLLSVPLYLFDKNRIPECVLYCDANPFGVASAIFNTKGKLLFYTNFKLTFISPHGMELKYQNVIEYLGYFLGIFLFRYCFTGVVHPKEWINHNTSALSWAEHDKCTFIAAQTVHIATTWLPAILGIPNPEIHHISGIEMGDIDVLSRFQKHSLSSEFFINLSQNLVLIEIVSLVDFTLTHTLDLHIKFMLRIHDILKNIIFKLTIFNY
jgi:hypothetical protein